MSSNWCALWSLLCWLLLWKQPCKAQYIAFIWLQIMTVPKFQTPLACFEKWLSPDFTCQEVEEAQKVSLKGCASATATRVQDLDRLCGGWHVETQWRREKSFLNKRDPPWLNSMKLNSVRDHSNITLSIFWPFCTPPTHSPCNQSSFVH